jgi:hypothetical protein
MAELKIMFLFNGGVLLFLGSSITLIITSLAMAEYDKTSRAMAWVACGPPGLFGICLIGLSALATLSA